MFKSTNFSLGIMKAIPFPIPNQLLEWLVEL